MNMQRLRQWAFGLAGLCGLAGGVQAGEWSDLAVNWRYGSHFAEPYNNQPVHKNILGLTYAGSHAFGSQFFSTDLLFSDRHDPDAHGSRDGAREAYVVYRNTLDLARISDVNCAGGALRGCGLTLGFDWNHKDDAGYNSRKRMLVAGPTLMFEVPGFLEASLLWLRESNRPSASPGAFDPGYPAGRSYFRTHPMLSLAWGIPLRDRLSFDGYANFIAAKGPDETGLATAAETHLDLRLMYDAGALWGSSNKALRLGVAYEYWRNKFGNDHNGPAGRGAFARTPMLRAEFRF